VVVLVVLVDDLDLEETPSPPAPALPLPPLLPPPADALDLDEFARGRFPLLLEPLCLAVAPLVLPEPPVVPVAALVEVLPFFLFGLRPTEAVAPSAAVALESPIDDVDAPPAAAAALAFFDFFVGRGAPWAELAALGPLVTFATAAALTDATAAEARPAGPTADGGGMSEDMVTPLATLKSLRLL
jgi:hypothetical protein